MGSEPAEGTVRFAECSEGREIAYRVLSQTPGPLVVHAHQGDLAMEVLEDDPMYDRFLRALGQAGTLVLFDKPGLGASDPFDPDRDYFEQYADAYLAVLDALDQLVERRAAGDDGHFEDQQRDGDGEHAVAECLHAVRSVPRYSTTLSAPGHPTIMAA